MYVDIALEVDWGSIEYAAKDYAKAVQTLYYDKSTYVFEEIYQAIEYITTYEEDDLVDSVAMGLEKIVIALQPGKIKNKI
jgi:hypothetical protein